MVSFESLTTLERVLLEAGLRDVSGSFVPDETVKRVRFSEAQFVAAAEFVRRKGARWQRDLLQLFCMLASGDDEDDIYRHIGGDPDGVADLFVLAAELCAVDDMGEVKGPVQ